jgi:NitT/TauT family transport system substrate-binding protein
LSVILFLSVAAGACNPVATSTRTHLTVGLGYIPSVQFAQFYRAQQQGYYRDAGLDVTFQNEIDPNLVTLVGQGAVDIGIADGTSVIPAVGQGIPIRYAATMYAVFPNIVIATGGIATPAELSGHSIGIPGRYGSSWIMLQALLASAGLTTSDVAVHDYPDFGQATGLRQGQVDAATGFRNNEAVQLLRENFPMNVLAIDAITPLPGPGLIVGEQTLATKKDALRAFVAATVRAMDEITADPRVGLADSIAVVPELASDEDVQLAILEATIEMWHSPYTDANGRGTIDPQAWQASLDFMRGLPDSNIPADLTVVKLITEELLP